MKSMQRNVSDPVGFQCVVTRQIEQCYGMPASVRQACFEIDDDRRLSAVFACVCLEDISV